ncbi:MAG: alpha-amylase family glycosyl hydrolase [Bacilli bacterium]
MKKKHRITTILLFSSLLFSCQSPLPEGEISESSQTSLSAETTENESSEETSSAPASETTSASSGESSSETSLPPISYVQVFAPHTYSHVYAWINASGGANELVGSWPGTFLKPFDEDWLTYDFQGYTALNVIFNTGSSANQTADLAINEPGYYWYHNGILVKQKPDSGVGGDDPSYPEFPTYEAENWKDFPFWQEYPASYWKTINKYNGSRQDFRNESIYFAITTRFYDGDPTNNVKCWDGHNPLSDPAWRGDFKGLIQKMDYIKALGFTAIWITPIVKNASGYDYHGYHALNFREVDERYLSADVSFQTVINEAHARDMKIILDVVFNHTGNFGEENLFPMFTKEGDLGSYTCMKKLPEAPLPAHYDSLNSNQQYDERIAAMKNTRNNGADPNDIYHHYGNFSWETFGEQVAQIAGDCVDLNTENPLVAEYLIKAYGEFIRMGVDAFRIDTLKHISRLTMNNYFFPALYEFARKCGHEHFQMFGEVCTRVRDVWNRDIPALSAPFYTWKENREYPWGDTLTNLTSIEQAYNDHRCVKNERTSQNAHLQGRTYHTPDYSQSSRVGVIDFPMHWNFQYAQDAFNIAVSKDHYYNDATYNVMYVDSHDYGPDCIQEVRYNQGPAAWAENMSLMWTFRGIPCLYYGSEIEFQKGKTIDKGPNILLSESGRAYYGDHLEGHVTASGFGTYSASGRVATTLSQPLACHLRKLNQIRLAIPALSLGQYTTQNVSGNMAFIRRYTKGSLDSLALVTISSGATFNEIPNGVYVDVVTGQRVTVSNGTLNVSLNGQGNLRVFVRENKATGTLGKIGETTTYLR